MKVYLEAYFNKNLGDDLFLYIISKRYKNHTFYSITPNMNYDFHNFKLSSNLLKYKVINKLKLEKFIQQKYDMILTVGGSMYMENNKNQDLMPKKKKQFILGSNFGPYKSREYFDKAHKLFESAEDVCFREKYSYELFKDVKSVRYASDIVFNLDTKDIKITNRKRAIISVIDCNTKIDEKYQEKYEEKIIELIYFLIKKKYEICLMSFCKNENDEVAIERIIEKIDLKYKKNVEKYYYNGNIEEALNNMGDSTLIIGSRFHAMMLGLLLGKTIIPINYSKKTNHILEENGINAKSIDINDIENFNTEDISDKDLNYKADISKLKVDARKQFEILDKYLNN